MALSARDKADIRMRAIAMETAAKRIAALSDADALKLGDQVTDSESQAASEIETLCWNAVAPSRLPYLSLMLRYVDLFYRHRHHAGWAKIEARNSHIWDLLHARRDNGRTWARYGGAVSGFRVEAIFGDLLTPAQRDTLRTPTHRVLGW